MELPELLEQQRALTTLGQNRSVNLDNISLTLQSLQRLSTESIFKSCQSCCSQNRQVDDELDRKELSDVSLHKVNSGDVKIIMSKPSWVETVSPAPDFSDTYDDERFDWLDTSLDEELLKDPSPSQSKEPQTVEKLKRFDSNNETPDFVDTKVFSDPSLYGSLPDQMDSIRNDAGQGPHRVIFCVHGKPSGCCATQIMVPDNVPPQTITIDTDEHCHIGIRNDGVDVKARKKIIFASVLCVFFMIAEMIGGFMSNSLAIATDAAHLLTDFASFMISLFALWVAARKPTRVFLFGWHRAEVIGAVASVLTIWVVTGILVYLAIERIVSRDYEIDTEIMLITSALGLLVNLIMGCALHQHTHHTHGHGHGEAENINVRAAFIHVVGDFIQSSGVFIAALLIYFNGPSWYIVDPICTFMFSILVMFTTFAILRDAMLVLMEGMPKGVEYAEVLDTLLSIDNVVRVHNLRIWALSLDKTALAAHIVINKNVSTDEILKIASRKIHAKYNFFEMTLQIEYFQEKMEDCKQCQEPEK